MSQKREGPVDGWSEADSATFIDYGRYYAPERELQIATVCGLIPPPSGPGPAYIVELCSGEGLLSRALLEAHPNALLHAYDGSPRMLEATRRSAGALGDRLTTHAFDLAAGDWRGFDWPLQAVVSSLAVHHLDGPQKSRLYADMAVALAPGGALVIADLVAPAGALAVKLAAETWDEEVRRRSMALDDGLAAFVQFRDDNWNFFSDPEPDPVDKPSALYDQLRWIEAAGLVEVDVYWMKAGHAIFGGRKPAGRGGGLRRATVRLDRLRPDRAARHPPVAPAPPPATRLGRGRRSCSP